MFDMKKIETIWHHLLYTALQEKKFRHTQKELANFFNYSLSTINHALDTPTQVGAIRKESKFFILADFQKLLYYWASVRNLKNDIIYQTYFEGSISDIEGVVNPEAIYACYSAASKLLGTPPADYTNVYFYYPEAFIKKVRRRFPPTSLKSPNIFVFKMPEIMKKYGPYTTLPQTFTDVWNLSDWYGKDFTNFLEEKMYGLLS